MRLILTKEDVLLMLTIIRHKVGYGGLSTDPKEAALQTRLKLLLETFD